MDEYIIKWDSAAWPERLDMLKEVLGLRFDMDLARYIGVHKTTVYDWKKNNRTPGRQRTLYLRDLYISTCLKNDDRSVNDAATTCALCTCAIDNTDPIFRTAIQFSDLMTIYNMLNALCVKFAHRMVVDLKLNCIPRVEYNYGAYPARTRLTLKFVDVPSKKIEFVFTHTTEEPVMYIMHMVTYINDIKRSECSFVANDAALVAATSRTIKFIKLRTYAPRR